MMISPDVRVKEDEEVKRTKDKLKDALGLDKTPYYLMGALQEYCAQALGVRSSQVTDSQILFVAALAVGGIPKRPND